VAGLFALHLISHSDPAAADPDPASQKFGWREMWGGADATKDVWLLYSGITLAPLSKDIYSDGLRIRLSGGYGQYRYVGRLIDCSQMAGAASLCTSRRQRYDVTYSYSDVLFGYYKRLGALTAKAFVGGSMVNHDYAIADPSRNMRGIKFGATGALELWRNVGERAWSSPDLEYTRAHGTGAARWRAGWRVQPALSVGPEVRYDMNDTDESGRAGLFVRYEWVGGELSIATGVASALVNGFSYGTDDFAPYVTVNMLTQF
jgi:hypothetical protein